MGFKFKSGVTWQPPTASTNRWTDRTKYDALPKLMQPASARQLNPQFGAAAGQLARAARAMEQPSGMPGLAVDLKERARHAERG